VIQIADEHAALLAVALRRLARDLERDGYALPGDLGKLADALLSPEHVATCRRAEQNAARCRRYRARKRQAA
jgi:hypothetical protein